TGCRVEHGMVRPMVAELHLDRTCAAGKAEELVAEADTECRNADAQEFADRVDGVSARLGVAGPVGKEDSLGLERKRVAGAGLRRHHGESAAAVAIMRRMLCLMPKS